MSQRKISVGIIGMGQMGMLHGGIVNMLPESYLAAICESNSRISMLGAKVIPGVKFYNDYLKMIEKESLDAVIVCTPALSHAKIASKIIEQGVVKGIFVEKPLATSFEEASALTAKAKGMVTMVGFQKRFCGTFVRAKELLKKDVIGKPRFFRSHFYTSENVQPGVGWKFEVGGGGVLLEFAPHLLDILNWYFGDPLVTQALKASFREGGGLPDYIHASITYNGGLVGYADICWGMRNYRPGEMAVEIHGDRGTISVNDSRILLYLDKDSEDFRAGIHSFPVASLNPSVPFLLAYPENVLIDRSFVLAVRTSRPTEPAFLAGMAVNRLIDQLEGRM